MNDIPQWASFAAALVVPALAFIGFWMSLSSRLTKAEVTASEAKGSAKEANEKAALLSASFALYREQIAREYIHREVMREVEDRLTQAIERLGDRLDRVLERSGFIPHA
jgi:DNA-binding transcriptional regulator YbjK